MEEMRPHAMAGEHSWWKWGLILLVGFGIMLIPPPEGITMNSWGLFAIFMATIVGSIVRPLAGGAIVLLGVVAVAVTGVLPGATATETVSNALRGYMDPIVWLVLAAFFISCGMVKTGLGKRIAYVFIRSIGHSTLGLGYSLIATDMVLASVIPSNAARSGGVIFPIARSISEAYESRPGPTSKRLGAYLMPLLYQSDVIICATFLTGQASNAIIAKFAATTANVELSYTTWLLASIVPSLVALLVVPFILYRIDTPEITETPDATAIASEELRKMGRMSAHEWLMLGIFGLIGILWMTTGYHGFHYAAVALAGIAALLLTGIIDWEDMLGEREAWDVFIWYGGLVGLADALSKTGITNKFAEASAGFTEGWIWWGALATLALIYFYAHYAFASITAHVTAMYIPFLVVVLAAGAPPWVAVLTLTFFSNLSASLTHYGTTPAPIYFGANYIKQKTWWRFGLIASIPNIVIWGLIGMLWWKIIGLW